MLRVQCHLTSPMGYDRKRGGIKYGGPVAQKGKTHTKTQTCFINLTTVLFTLLFNASLEVVKTGTCSYVKIRVCLVHYNNNITSFR